MIQQSRAGHSSKLCNWSVVRGQLPYISPSAGYLIRRIHGIGSVIPRSGGLK